MRMRMRIQAPLVPMAASPGVARGPGVGECEVGDEEGQEDEEAHLS